MELALRALEKQKEEKERSDKDHPQESRKGQGQDNQQQSGEKKAPSPSSDNEKEESSKEAQDPSDKGENGSRDKQGQRAKEKSPHDLKGELKPIQELPREDQEEASEKNAASVDKQRAEALLDNIKEDPSQLLRFMIPEEKRQGAASPAAAGPKYDRLQKPAQTLQRGPTARLLLSPPG